jgi:hypothetical protein
MAVRVVLVGGRPDRCRPPYTISDEKMPAVDSTASATSAEELPPTWGQPLET